VAEAVILCGGYSSRIGENKMMLELAGHPLIWHTVAGVSRVTNRVIIVTGHYHDDISKLFSGWDNVVIIRNTDYEKGMFSSVKCGVRQTESDFFVLPGDHPLVKEATFKLLLSGTKDVRVPAYAGRKGHPVFFSRRLKEALLDEPDDSNLKIFRNHYDVEIFETDDEGIIKDVDTLKDFFYIQNLHEEER